MAVSLPKQSAAVRPEFRTTHWSVILAAGQDDSDEANQALESLCRTYWYPLYAYIRRSGHGVEDAQDLTQEFFARLLQKQSFSRVGPEKGRFRSYLLAALKYFLANEWHRVRAEKRGGGRRLIPLDEILAETRYGFEPAHELTAERIYEQRWALTLLDEVLARLRTEHDKNLIQFDALKIFLTAEKSPSTYAEIGARFGMSEGAVKVAVHRLRQRYLELLRGEIANTVASPAEIDDELRHLISVLK